MFINYHLSFRIIINVSYPFMKDMGPYGAAYPQDELSKIKMRNRRFQQSCAMEGMHLYGPAIGPVWRGGCTLYSRLL